MFRFRGLLFLLMLACAGAQAADVTELLARCKTASGGERWDDVRSVEVIGALDAGGLSGTYVTVQDLTGLRSASHYTLGPVEGAEGYDGAVGWTRDPGGEVETRDAAEARRRAVSQAWLDGYAYWYPQRHAAHWGEPVSREADGARYLVVTATPEGGDPLELWFDADSGLLARSIARSGSDTLVTRYADWRAFDGRRVPTEVVTDTIDAAGRTNPARRSAVTVRAVRWNVAVDAAAFAVPQMAATTHIDDASGIARIPFDLVNQHIYVEARIDDKPVRLLVDTGGINLLTPAAARRLGLDAAGKLAGRGVGEEEVDVGMAHARTLRVGAATLDRPLFYVMDLGELPAVEGLVADGLVGYEMFRRFGVTIDYAGRTLSVAEPGRFAPPAGAQALPFELAERIPIIRGMLDGVPLRISVDTGSRSSLTLHAPFVLAHDLVARYQAGANAVVGWGVGGPSRGRPARFGRLMLGELAVDGIAGDLYTGDKGSFASSDLDANLGGGVLSRFTVAFDYAARRLYLAPNARFGQADAFDRSGLWLMADGDALRIADVAAGSAGEKAGLKVGDRLRTIGGEAIGARTLSDWRTLLRERAAGTALTLDYLRDGKPATATLVLADRVRATSTVKP